MCIGKKRCSITVSDCLKKLFNKYCIKIISLKSKTKLIIRERVHFTGILNDILRFAMHVFVYAFSKQEIYICVNFIYI